MDRTEIDRYRELLRELGRRSKKDFSDLSNEALRRSGGEASGNLSNTPMHLADLGTDNFEQELSMNLLEKGEDRLEEIGAALERIEQGQFGVCEECGKEIGRERLDALPYARLCVSCARQREEQAAEETRAGL